MAASDLKRSATLLRGVAVLVPDTEAAEFYGLADKLDAMAVQEPETRDDSVAGALKRIAARRMADEADIRIIVGDPMQCVKVDLSGA